MFRSDRPTFADHHRSVIHLTPAAPRRVLDIGDRARRGGFCSAGTHRGRQPTEELRRAATALHLSPKIEWVDDSLPDLALVRARSEEYDVIMLSAVWMHLDELQRRQAMPNVSALLRNGGVISMATGRGGFET
jgi:hypothetical protein